MKKLIALAVVASAFASFAEDNVFGCLAIESSAEETIICVPWLQPGATSDDSSIKVTDVIKTSNLLAGDEFRYYDLNEQKYLVWGLVVDDSGNKSWVWGGQGEEPPQSIARGGAVLLIRKNIGGRADKKIYVYGQVGTATTKTCDLGAGSATAACYSLIAPPTVGETNLNSGTTWVNIDAKSDYIVLPNMKILVWNGTQWGEEGEIQIGTDGKITKPFEAEVAKIPAGQGAWFVSGRSRTVSGTPSVTWSNLPSVGSTTPVAQ